MKNLLLLLAIFFPAYGGDPASRVNQVLEQLKNPKQQAVRETFILTQDEVNSWSSIAIGSKKRLGVQSLLLDFREGGQFQVQTCLNMGEVEVQGFSIQLFQALLRGDQEFVLEGRLSCAQGRATATVQRALINDVPIPKILVDAVIGYLSQKQPPHLNLSQPFNLPFGIQDIQIVEGRVIISR